MAVRAGRFVAAFAVVSGALLAIGGLRAPAQVASAENVLANPGFETWVGGLPAGWPSASSGAVSQNSAGAAGLGARINAAGPGNGLASKSVEVATPGSTVSASVQFSGDTSASLSIEFLWWNSDLVPLITTAFSSLAASGSWVTASAVTPVPPGAAHVALRFKSLGSGSLTVDNASLEIVAPPPTSTPTSTSTPAEDHTATPTPTPTEPAPDASPTGTAGTTPGAGDATATRTPTPTRTSTPTRTPTGTRTPSPTNTRAPIPGPRGSPSPPLPISTPTLAAGSSSGGLLANGDFELVQDGKPAYWEKFGGTLFSGSAFGGSSSGCLESTTASVKWLYQVVSVEGGGWYSGLAVARVEGRGAASIRVSWYTSTDGSGSQMESVESNLATGSVWSALATGTVQAPDDARSARVRLTLQPDGTSTACFDDAVFAATKAPAATPVPSGRTTSPGSAATGTPRPGASATTAPVRLVPGAAGAGPGSQGLGAATDGPASLRLSEVLSDPVEPGRDAEFEWVEVVNIGDAPLDTNGWQLADGTVSRALPAGVIPPGAYFVIRGASATVPSASPSGVNPGGQIGNGLGNTGDALQLIAPGGAVADVMSYGDNEDVFGPAPEAPAPGATIGVFDPRADPASENWAVTLRPTPGEANVFAPKPIATVAGASQPRPGGDQQDPDTVEVIEGDDGGPRIAPWIILGAIGGLSLGVGAAKVGPRLRELKARARAS